MEYPFFAWQQWQDDGAYVWEMYPLEAKILKRYADEELDMQDYGNSFIYDEYPDKFLFLQMARKIRRRYFLEHETKEECLKHLEKNIDSLSQVILANEIQQRRRQKRKMYYV